MKVIQQRLLPLLISLLLILSLAPALRLTSHAAGETPGLSHWCSYYFRNANSGQYLDLASSGVTNGTHFQQYPFGYMSEIFCLFYLDNGYYNIVTMLPNATPWMVMDGRSNCVAGAQVVLYEQVTCDEQQWQIRKNANGSYCLSPKKNLNLNLAVENASTASNAKVKLAAKNDSAKSQQWFIEEVPVADGINNDTVYYVRNKNSGKYLDLQGSSTANSTHIQQYPFGSNGYPSERFRITVHAHGAYVIQSNLSSSTAMKVMDGRSNCVAGAQVILYDFVGGDEQYWHFRKNEDGTYYISPLKNVYLNLTVEGGSLANNAKVKLAARNANDDAQKWILEPATRNDYKWGYMFSDSSTYSRISSGFNIVNLRPSHYALDIVSKTSSSINGKPIYSPVSGTVVDTKLNHYGSGNYIIIDTDYHWTGQGERIRIAFAHLNSAPIPKKDEIVRKGDLIGYVGVTGLTDGPHLHYATFRPGLTEGNQSDHWEREETCINPQYFHPTVPFDGLLNSTITLKN